MPLRYFLGKNGRLGVAPAISASPATAFTASSTVSVAIPVPFGQSYIAGASVTASNQAAGGGALTVTLVKVRAGSSTTLTAAFSLTSSGITNAAGGTFAIPLLTTLSGVDRTLQPGDRVQVNFIAAGTVTTNITQCHVALELDRVS